MAERIRCTDWSQTPLGPMKEWPPELRVQVDMMLSVSKPISIYWGKEYTLLYNDAWRKLIGDKHPSALGRSAHEVLPEIWDQIETTFTTLMEGEYVSNFERERPSERNIRINDTWYNCTFIPISLSDGAVGGIFHTASEVSGNKLDEERYYTLFKSIDEGCCIIEMIFDEDKEPVDYRFLETNPAFVELTGLENIEGRRILEMVPELEKHWLETFGKVALTGEAIRFQNRAKHVPKPSVYDLYAFRFGEPEERKVAVLFNDITEQKEAQKALQNSERQLRLATQAADMHLCEVDLRNNTFDWSNNVTHQVNFPMPQTLEEARALLHPEDEEKVLKVLRKKAKEEGNFEIEYRVKDPVEGETIWVYSAGTAIKGTEWRGTRIISVSKNITKRKRAELLDQFLSRLSRKIQGIADPNEIMAATTKLLGDHLEVDRCTYAEIEEDENHFTVRGNFSGGEIPSMEPKGAMADFGEEALRLMRENKLFVVDDVTKDERITRDDEPAYKQNHIQALICVPLNKNGHFRAKMAVHQQYSRTWHPDEIQLLQIVTDRCWETIERARVTRKLQEMNETLEERVTKRTKALKTYQHQLQSLASELNKAEEHERQRLAEELHNNLGQMLALGKIHLEMLKKEELPDDRAKYLETSAGLIDDALTYTRELMSNLKPPPDLEEKNLREVICWVAKNMEKHGLTTTIEEDGQPKPLEEEARTTLRRCVEELLYNIVKHADTNSARIFIAYDAQKIQVTVEDEGSGFNTESEFYPGNDGGFGLFNIRERMNWLGGRFDIESEPGTGTKVLLEAPLKEGLSGVISTENGNGDDHQSDVPRVASSVQRDPRKKIRVMIVDDHEMMREGLKNLLKGEDDMIIVAEADDGEEAIKLVGEISPDVIVMDVNLPGISGIEATQKITTAQQDVAIIGLSLYEWKKVAQNMKKAGAVAYLTKTEAFDSLCATIRDKVNM